MPSKPRPPVESWLREDDSESQNSDFSTIWPYRLLHVPSMTSYARTGLCNYNGVKAPRYNVISYTWGNFVDSKEPSIVIKGVDWPIPAIRKDHFTADTFKAAMQRACKGVNHKCEWLWVDIACIPQKHKNESKEARNIRGEEIGRQVEIFRRAHDAFAWLSNLKTSEFSGGQSFLTIQDFNVHVCQDISIEDAEAPVSYLRTCDSYLRLIESWMNKFLSHSWLSSLWTLQEMVLRRDSWILFDDGCFSPYSYDVKSPEDEDYSPWNFIQIKNDIFTLQRILDGNGMKNIENAEKRMVTRQRTNKASASNIRKRLERLVERLISKGLNTLGIEIPHAAYSAAQNRNAREITDRIYGIVQTYEISCNPEPAGKDELAKLRNLEDEFGTKLLAKSALLSQLFVHTSSNPPRRSWLITQKCTIDRFWVQFFRPGRVFNQKSSLSIVEDTRNITLNGKAWYLNSLKDSMPPHLFEPTRGGLGCYNGLMLDYHVSKKVLGNVIDYFESQERLIHAVGSLDKHYGKPVRVAVLGSVQVYSTENFIGLVLAPVENSKGKTMWMRIGLYQWVGKERGKQLACPPCHDIRCTIT